MKLINCFFLFCSFQSFGQSSIESSFNDVYIGRNFNVSWKNTHKKISYSAGLTYHVNRIDKAPIGTLIKKSAIARNVSERFGTQLGFEYYLLQNSYCKVGLFYNNQISLISQVHKMYYAYDTLIANPQSEFDFLYVKSEMSFGPLLTIDNIIGLTLINKLTKDFYLTSKGGFGFLYWWNTDDSFLLVGGNKNNQNFNLTSFFSIGLGYFFNKKE